MASMKKRDALGRKIIADAMYYVEDSRSVVGNCMSWWGHDGKGYVCELNEAGQYTGERVASMRDTDVPWPVGYIQERAVLHVRRDLLR